MCMYGLVWIEKCWNWKKHSIFVQNLKLERNVQVHHENVDVYKNPAFGHIYSNVVGSR